jgi:hypothetical protein
MARNAHGWTRFCAGRSGSRAAKVPVTLLILGALLLLPAGSRAADPLLSGYAGPGGGEQVVLGGALIDPPSGGGSGRTPGSAGLRATPAPAPSASSSPSGSSSSAGAGSARGTSARPRSGAHAKGSRRAQPAAGGSGVATAGAATAGAPPVRAYPAEPSGAGGLPLPGAALIAALAALVALVLLGLGLRRLTGARFAEPGTPQVSGPHADIPG